MQRRSWDGEEESKLRRALEEARRTGPFVAEEVARIFGRPVGSVREKVRREWGADGVAAITGDRGIPPESMERIGGGECEYYPPSSEEDHSRPPPLHFKSPCWEITGHGGIAQKAKRLLVVSDFHCGHRVGLTPPKWQAGYPDKYTELRRRYWEFYASTVESLKPIDMMVVNGDAVGGKGASSGGTDYITVDRVAQIAMAMECIKFAEPAGLVIILGTPFHTGKDEDWEEELFNRCCDSMTLNVAKLGEEEDVIVNGLVVNCKHFIGSSQVPHGRHTAIARDRLWNLIWAEHEQRPKAHVLIRSHVHYFSIAGGSNWIGFATPALQGLGCKFGARKPSGIVDFGLMHFDIEGPHKFSYEKHELPLATTPAQPVVVP